jgi:hypothetical protein
MRRGLVVIATALLAVAGCGGDDDEPSATSEGSEATGTVEGASYDITVGEFIAELQPQKQAILKEFVADTEACQGVKADSGFVLLVTAQAIDADQEAPLAGFAEEQC